MTLSASAPRWANADHTLINLVVDHPTFGLIPFTASPDDVEESGRDLYTRAIAGEFGAIAAYSAPPSPPPPIPQQISRRQCASEMFARTLISGPEAVAMTATATPPAMVEAMISALTEPSQTMARIDFAATTYERTNALLVALMEGAGATSADIDEFFRNAGAR